MDNNFHPIITELVPTHSSHHLLQRVGHGNSVPYGEAQYITVKSLWKYSYYKLIENNWIIFSTFEGRRRNNVTVLSCLSMSHHLHLPSEVKGKKHVK